MSDGLGQAIWVLRSSSIAPETRQAATDFLVGEAELLDNRRFEDWLGLFTDDVAYTAPVRAVLRSSAETDVIEDSMLFDENKRSLTLRVRRLLTDVAWAEDPPSFTRRYITNFRFTPGPGDTELTVKTNLLLYRSRGTLGESDLIAGERTDVLRLVEGRLRIASRRIVVDQATLSTKNLGVFL
jgi:PAH dioxygenase small subunit